jgi:hypothetical protein
MRQSEFTEDDFIGRFCSVLGRYPYFKLWVARISQKEEFMKGYDATIKLKKVVYLQFKRSNYFSVNSYGRIRNAREKLGFSRGEDFYSFNLYQKKSGFHCHQQHNLLWKLGQSHDAFYCAPLFHTMSEIDEFSSFDETDINIDKELCFDEKSMMKNTILIKPDKEVIDSKLHRYTYDKFNNVLFHSNPKKINGSVLFSDYLNKQANIEREDKKVSFTSIFNYLDMYFEKKKSAPLLKSHKHFHEIDYKIDLKKLPDKATDFKIGHILEDILKDNYNIFQYCIFSEEG